MESYNVPQDEGYNVKNNYGTVQQHQSNTYGGSQSVTVSLPVYQEIQQQISSRRSRCPRGAVLNRIGSCCGDQCSRACAIEG